MCGKSIRDWSTAMEWVNPCGWSRWITSRKLRILDRPRPIPQYTRQSLQYVVVFPRLYSTFYTLHSTLAAHTIKMEYVNTLPSRSTSSIDVSKQRSSILAILVLRSYIWAAAADAGKPWAGGATVDLSSCTAFIVQRICENARGSYLISNQALTACVTVHHMCKNTRRYVVVFDKYPQDGVAKKFSSADQPEPRRNPPTEPDGGSLSLQKIEPWPILGSAGSLTNIPDNVQGPVESRRVHSPPWQPFSIKLRRYGSW